MFIVINKKRIIIFVLIFICILGTVFYKFSREDNTLVAGGVLFRGEKVKYYEEEVISMSDHEKYFRPSNIPILNTSSEAEELLNQYSGNSKKVVIPDNYLITPNKTIINYFSVLREAANVERDKWAGCGTIGRWREPYRIAYEFFTKEYKERVNFKAYEIETIQGSKENIANFVYYYGFINLSNENGVYKIKDITISPEEYLCAPYHGWSYDGKSKVEIEYGDWCKLIKEFYEVNTEGYVKNIYFKGTDNKDYRIEFYILTNDYDIEVAQYIKEDGKWKSIKLDPNKCLKEE